MLLYFINLFHASVLIDIVCEFCADSYLLLRPLILNLAGKPQSILVYYKTSYFIHLTYH